MDRGIAPNGKWGKELNFNFFVTTTKEMHRFAKNGCDQNSVNGDPLFVDPIKGDFSVKDVSPALKIGFVNFPMNQFGVKKPALKAIAKMPVIPAISIKTDEEKSRGNNLPIEWLGAELSEPVGDELSAFGAAFAEGGVAIMQLDESSILKKYGLKAGDLIQKINATKIKNTTDLKTYLEANQKWTNHTFFILRNQQKMEIKVNQILPVMDKN
jgi:hypothetical protein